MSRRCARHGVADRHRRQHRCGGPCGTPRRHGDEHSQPKTAPAGYAPQPGTCYAGRLQDRIWALEQSAVAARRNCAAPSPRTRSGWHSRPPRRGADRSPAGKPREAVDRAQARAPFVEAEAGFDAEQARQRAPAGAGAFRPIVETEMVSGCSSSARRPARARIARHRHMQLRSCMRASSARIRCAISAAAGLVIVERLFQRGQDQLAQQAADLDQHRACGSARQAAASI